MPDLEFLPSWYPQLRVSRRRFILGATAVAVLAVMLFLGLSKTRAIVEQDERSLAELNRQLAQTDIALEKLRHLSRLRDQWLKQESILRQAGVQVEASRLIASIGHALPKEASLLECTFAVEEQEAPPTTAPAEESAPASGARRLKVKLVGVAPGELAVAAFLTGLSQTPLFEHVNLMVAKDREQDGKVVREFEVTFVIDLSTPVQG